MFFKAIAERFHFYYKQKVSHQTPHIDLYTAYMLHFYYKLQQIHRPFIANQQAFLICTYKMERFIYSRTKLVCEKWNGTQRHKDTELYFLREQSSQNRVHRVKVWLYGLYLLYIFISPCLCVQYKGLTDFSQSIAD